MNTKMKVVLTVVALAFGTSGTIFADGNETLKVDPSKSKVSWKAEKVTGEHLGEVKIENGTINMKDGKVTSGSFVINMASISCTDIEDAGTNAKLIGHLKSDDFFGVEKHPQAMLEIKKAIPQGKDHYKMVGEMTIKGITKEVRFHAELKQSGNSVKGEAQIVIDRTDFNVRYGSGSFFDDLGDKTIYDNFTLKVSLTANS